MFEVESFSRADLAQVSNLNSARTREGIHLFCYAQFVALFVAR